MKKKPIMLIQDVDMKYVLVNIDYEVKAIDDYLGQVFEEQHSYFVTQKDGGYISILYFKGTAPYLDKEVTVIL